LAAAIKKELGVVAKLIPGSSGIFDVKADGKLVFSKHEVGRFPEDREVLEALGVKKK
jgi:selenoprotein W-related protein